MARNHDSTLTKLLWGTDIRPLPRISAHGVAFLAGTCLLTGIPILTIFPPVAWNGLVGLRNRLRHVGH